MKYYDLFAHYIWLVNTIHRAGSISFKEINRLWIKTDMSGGLPMPRSTFNRHKMAIEEIFGLVIECNHKDGYKFFISNENVLHEDSIQNWMLSTIAVNNVIRESISLKNRILIENIPSSKGFLQIVLDAMKYQVCIAIVYRKYSSSESKSYHLKPYCLKLYRQRWYLLGRTNDNAYKIFSLDRMEDAILTDEPFAIDEDFDAEEYFRDCYGVYHDKRISPERVVLRAFDNERFFLRDLPLHHSQVEVNRQADYSDFEYHLCPTADFIGQILLQAHRIKVLEPLWIQQKVCDAVRKTLKMYEEE